MELDVQDEDDGDEEEEAAVTMGRLGRGRWRMVIIKGAR